MQSQCIWALILIRGISTSKWLISLITKSKAASANDVNGPKHLGLFMRKRSLCIFCTEPESHHEPVPMCHGQMPTQDGSAFVVTKIVAKSVLLTWHTAELIYWHRVVMKKITVLICRALSKENNQLMLKCSKTPIFPMASRKGVLKTESKGKGS